MATVYKRGGTWWVRFQWNGQEIRKSARTTVKGEARQYLEQLQAQYRALDLGGRARVTFDAAAVQYIQEHVAQLEVSTIASYQQSLRALTAEFSGLHLDEITRKRIAAFEAKQARRVSPSKLKHYRAALSGVFRVAMRHDQIDSNPCRALDPITVKNERYRFLSPDEWQALYKALPEPLRSIAEISVVRGLRCGEILSLEWRDVDFTRGELRLRVTKNRQPRIIPLEGAKGPLQRQAGRKGLVFPGTGKGMSVAEVSRAVNQYARDAKIPDFTFHDLRHTYASWYVQSGGDLYKLQRILGHKTPAMTQRYAHLRIEDLRAVAQKPAQGTRDFLN